jgi:hypothetical protein
MELVNKKMYPHLYCILKMYPTMPLKTKYIFIGGMGRL